MDKAPLFTVKKVRSPKNLKSFDIKQTALKKQLNMGPKTNSIVTSLAKPTFGKQKNAFSNWLNTLSIKPLAFAMVVLVIASQLSFPFHADADGVSLTVVVQVMGGPKSPSDFNISVTDDDTDPLGPPPLPGSFPGSNSTTSPQVVSVVDGNITVTETNENTFNYVTTYSGTCSGPVDDSVDVEALCTITNTYTPPPTTGQVTVVTNVNNTHGGMENASDFNMTVTAASSSPASPFAGSDSGVAVTLDPGSYTITGSTDPDYTSSSSPDCAGTIAAGDTNTCTITYSDIAPPVEATSTAQLNVITHVINNYGGLETATDFNMTVTGTDVSPTSTFAGSEAGVPVTLDAGSYTVTGSDDPNYTSFTSGDCSGTLAADDNKTCTVNYSDISPQLETIVHVIGGPNVASDFTVNVTATVVSSASFPGSETGTKVATVAGAYSIDEADSLGYVKTLSSDCNSSVSIGQLNICTITNTYPSSTPTSTTGTIIVNKYTDPDSDTTTNFAFNLGGNGTDTDFSLTGGGTQTFSDIPTGDYSITETPTDGWTLSNSSCVYSSEDSVGSAITNGESVSLDSGDVITCSFYNTQNQEDGGGTSVADPAVTKTVDNGTPIPGATITYTVTASNGGTADATGVAVTDPLPSSVTYVSDDSASSSTSSVFDGGTNTLTWNIGTLSAGSSDTLHIIATVNGTATGTIANTATITSVGGGNSNTADDSATATATVTPICASPVNEMDLYSGTGTLTAGWTNANPVANPLDAALYSDNSTSTNAVAANPVIPPWYSPVSPAIWISTDANHPGETGGEGSPSEDQWRLFETSFNIPSTASVSPVTLYYTADNAATVYLNGSPIASTSDLSTFDPPIPNPPTVFSNIYSVTFVPFVGTNTVDFVVRNEGGNYTDNPTGLLYHLTYNEQDNCIDPSDPPSDPPAGGVTDSASLDISSGGGGSSDVVGGGSSSSGGGSSGGGQVLGDTIYAPGGLQVPPTGEVLGASTGTLPRTGMPPAELFMILGAAAILLSKKIKLI